MTTLASILSHSSATPAFLLGAGICLFAAFAHVLVWASNQRARANLLFALLSATVMGMMLVSIDAEGSASSLTGRGMHQVLRAVLWALLVWFPSLHRGARQLRLAFLLSCGFAAWGLLVLGLCMAGIPPEMGSTADGAGNAALSLVLSWSVLQTGAVAHLLHHAFYLRKNSDHYLFVVALLLFAGTAIHDTLLDLGLLPPVSLTEFGFLFFVLAMSRDLAHSLHARATESEDRGRAVRLIANSIPAMVAYFDTEQRLVFANKMCLKQLGARDANRVIGHLLETLLPETEYQESKPYVERALAGESVRYELSIATREGCSHWVDVSILPDHDDCGVLRGIFALAYDVTPHRAAERAARRSEERFRALVDACPMGILRYELDADDKLILIGANPAASTILGDLTGTIGKTIEEAFPALKDTELPRRFQNAAINGERWRSQIAYDEGAINGTYDFHVFQTTPGRVAVLFQDVTERLRQQAELSRLAAAIGQAAEAVVITDTRGIIKYVNPAFVSVTGYTADEALGRNPHILKSGQHDASFYKELWDTILSGQTWRGRFINHRKDGEPYTEQAVISPVRDQNGAITNFVCVKQDVTDALQMELQLRQSQKMEAIGQLAGGVAHDFNNILQAIEGYTELANLELPKDSTISSYIGEIRKAADRAANLTRQLLTFSRRESLQTRPVDLNHVITELLKMLHRILGEHIELKIEDCPTVHTIMADPGQIEQILLNLCINARDAMPTGGQISIACGNAAFDQAFCDAHPWAKTGTYAFLSVRDTGCGIPTDVKEHIFEPFFTTKPLGEGTGLGLATVYAVAQRHNGFIRIESKEDKGSAFTVYFPTSVPEQEPDAAATAAPVYQGGTETILLAEDDPMVRMLAVTILERAGYTLHVGTDGAEAIALLDSVGEKLDMALLDVIMPRHLGTEVMSEIRRRELAIPILFSSGFGDPCTHQGDVKEEFALLRKPYTPDVLLARVRELLDSTDA